MRSNTTHLHGARWVLRNLGKYGWNWDVTKARAQFSILMVAAALISGCWIVKPGAVEVSNTAGAVHITGSFVLVDDAAGHIEGTKGGGCLIFRPKYHPTHCTTAAGCPFPMPAQATSSAYCVDDETAAQTKTCWFKVSEAYCNKFPDGLTAYDTKKLPVVDPHAPLGRTEQVLWRVVTCQTLSDPGCKEGQEGIHKITRYGPISAFDAF